MSGRACGRSAIPWGALSRTNIAGNEHGDHHDGSDDDALADEGGGGECGDHVLRTDEFERGWGSMLVRLYAGGSN